MPGGVTLFGGTGFIGRALTRRLLAGGARVRVAARRPEA
ncbi:MAG: NAD-dependent epimerase/dehydratase family protein, partial [Proteobacteria bacterium]|nr:NAD-dependent epimerase/dehydratase family protein [Pseudomonadota bacterium]